MADPDETVPPDTTSPPPKQARALTQIVDEMAATAEAGQSDVDTLVRVAGGRGVLPIMTFTALLIVSPLSGIPFVSSICGTIIALCALQAAIGRRRLWLPGFLKRRQINPRRLVAAMARIRRVARWLERRATRRLGWLSLPPASQVFLVFAASYGAVMPFLELVPMSSSLLALAVVLTGLGLMLRDGVLLLISLLPPILAAFIVWSIWFS